MDSRHVSDREEPPEGSALSGVFRRMRLSDAAPSPSDSLKHARVSNRVIEGFRPFNRSLPWRLAEAYWGQAGLQPFIDNSIPNLINNSGAASLRAAAVLLAACVERGDSEAAVVVLELGAGLGLFARYFLDTFRGLCAAANVDFYERLQYIVTDGARKTVEKWAQCDLFSDHPGKVLMGICNACRPDSVIGLAGTPLAIPAPRLLICNYVLDVLPVAFVRTGATQPEELCVRTHLLTDTAIVRQYTTLDIEAMRELAGSDDAAALVKLLPLTTLLELETAWNPIEGTAPNHLAEALEFSAGAGRIVLNYGALDALDAWLARLGPAGCVLIRDYGSVGASVTESQPGPQRFGGSTAVGLNFNLLEHHARARGWDVWTPQGDAQSPIHVRLICRQGAPRAVEAFLEHFAAGAEESTHASLTATMEHIRAGRNDAALECFNGAVAHNPRNWFIVGSAAEFVGLQLRDYSAGTELAQAALELNPFHSTWLWNVLGDILYCMQQFDAAHEAYLQALQIDNRDPRTNLNLTYTLLQFGDLDACLQAVARGLSQDRDAAYTDRLLEKQSQALAALSARAQAERDRLAKQAAAIS